jgi:hypothetical protein
MKMTEGRAYFAISNRHRISFSLSPTYLLTRLEVDTLKKVPPVISLAQALANSVLPVPGGW